LLFSLPPHVPSEVADLDALAGRLLAALDALTTFREVSTRASAPLIEPLTAREQEVLRLLAAGYSNPAIAAQLVVSIGTVKAHTGQIFGKLAVHNRTQAVNRARELGLI
jgi:LuxR family maltose regulon positive regulatory protein